jgi:ATP synthase protein I
MPDKRTGEDAGESQISSADKAAFERRVDELGDDLDEAHARQEAHEASKDSAARARGMAYGLRMASELVGAVLVGGLIGYFLDRSLGSGPWLFLVFFFLGFAAGVLNVMRGFRKLEAEIKAATQGDIGQALPPDNDND